MPERHTPSPEQETRLAPSSWERLMTTVKELQRLAGEISASSDELLTHEDVRIGTEAAIRTVINIAISCADIVPGAGELASWGADALKILEDVHFRRKQAQALARGEDPRNIHREKYNLTPDVHVLVATLTEALEFVTFFTMPTHAIETTAQLWHDVPRMRRGVQKARAVLEDVRERRAQAKAAADHFTNNPSSET